MPIHCIRLIISDTTTALFYYICKFMSYVPQKKNRMSALSLVFQMQQSLRSEEFFFDLTEKVVFKFKAMLITVHCISTRCPSWISLDPLFLIACAGFDGISEIFIWTDYILYSICPLTASLHIKLYYEQPLSFNVTGPITTKSRWSQAELWTLKWAMSVLGTLVRIIAFHDNLHFFWLFFLYGDVMSHQLQWQMEG